MNKRLIALLTAALLPHLAAAPTLPEFAIR